MAAQHCAAKFLPRLARILTREAPFGKHWVSRSVKLSQTSKGPKTPKVSTFPLCQTVIYLCQLDVRACSG
jgi:hypothetical protein